MAFDPKDYEPGEDVTHLVKPPRERPGVVVSVRLDRADAEQLFRIAESSRRTISQVARDAVHDYLTTPKAAQQLPTVTAQFLAGVTLMPPLSDTRTFGPALVAVARA